jgi:hypothetical protein
LELPGLTRDPSEPLRELPPDLARLPYFGDRHERTSPQIGRKGRPRKPPGYRRAVLGNRWLSRSGWGTDWPPSAGQTLRGLKFIIYILSFCGPSPKHKVPTNGTENWSPGLILCATCTIFRAAPGARRGPQGAKNRPKARGRIYHVILPKVCPAGCPR